MGLQSCKFHSTYLQFGCQIICMACATQTSSLMKSLDNVTAPLIKKKYICARRIIKYLLVTCSLSIVYTGNSFWKYFGICWFIKGYGHSTAIECSVIVQLKMFCVKISCKISCINNPPQQRSPVWVVLIFLSSFSTRSGNGRFYLLSPIATVLFCLEPMLRHKACRSEAHCRTRVVAGLTSPSAA